MKPMHTKPEKIYVKVDSTFDATGYMQPTSITWADGRTFPIEKVRDFRPAGTADNGYSGDCFTVLILRLLRLRHLWSVQTGRRHRKGTSECR